MPNVSQMPIYDASAFYDSWLYKFPDKIKNFRFWHIKEMLFAFVEKFLKKFKIMLLKFENALNNLAVKLKKKRNNGERIAVVEKLSIKNNSSPRLIEDLSKIFNSIKEDVVAKEEDGDDVISIEKQEKFNHNLFIQREKNILEEIRISPRNMELYKKLGFLYFEYKNYEDALSSFGQAVKLGCNDKKVLEAIEDIGRNL